MWTPSQRAIGTPSSETAPKRKVWSFEDVAKAAFFFESWQSFGQRIGQIIRFPVEDDYADFVNDPRQPSRVLAIAAGKGGVGKSFLSANLSLTLAKRNRSVLAVDLDLGGANLHTLLGAKNQGKTLSSFVKGRSALEDLAFSAGHEKLRMISGAQDDVFSANPSHQEKRRLLRHLAQLDSDFVVLDLGAGSTLNTLDFFLLAEHQVLVVLPEPTSIENAYRFLKAAFIRRLANVGRELGVQSVVNTARSERKRLGIKTPADLLRAIVERDPKRGPEVFARMSRFSPFLILNQSRVDTQFDDRQIARDMVSASKRFFGISLRLLGCVPIDDNVRLSVRERTPLVQFAPRSYAADAIERIVDEILRYDEAEERGR